MWTDVYCVHVWQSSGQALEDLTHRISILEWAMDSDGRGHQQMDIVKRRLNQPVKAMVWCMLLTEYCLELVTEGIVFNVAMQTYRLLHAVAALYLQKFVRGTDIPSWQRLRSSTTDSLFVPIVRLSVAPFLLLVHMHEMIYH